MNTTWSKADIHLHTTHSDGNNSVAEVLAYVATCTDLRVIAVTDHDTIAGALEARRLAGSYGIEVVVGAEISTADGHLLALFIEELVPAGRPAAETITAVHEQGGLCLPAHPYGQLVPSMGRRGLLQRAGGPRSEWPIDGIECFNASLWRQANNASAARAAAELNVASCGGSDSHHLTTIGAGYTLFPGRTAADLRVAICACRTQAGGRFWGWGEIAVAAGPWARRELRGLGLRVPRPA